MVEECHYSKYSPVLYQLFAYPVLRGDWAEPGRDYAGLGRA